MLRCESLRTLETIFFEEGAVFRAGYVPKAIGLGGFMVTDMMVDEFHGTR